MSTENVISQEAPEEEITGVKSLTYQAYTDGRWQEQTSAVVREMALAIYVNGVELVTVLCTPLKLNALVLGFLYSEGIISSVNEVVTMRVCLDDSLADVKLTKSEVKLPQRRVLTSGCGGGSTFTSDGETRARLDSSLTVFPEDVLSLMKQMQTASEVYRQFGGVHTSALSDGKNLLVVAEDIGRHNTLDKIAGECLLRGIPAANCLLLSTGRLSSEMLLKTYKLKLPIVVSRGAATDRSIEIADKLGITLVSYARANRLTAYTHAWRLQPDKRHGI